MQRMILLQNTASNLKDTCVLENNLDLIIIIKTLFNVGSTNIQYG